MVYGYLRVSTDMQDVNSQRQGVEQFARSRNLTIDKYITDEGVSGGKDPDKRNLGPMLKKLTKGDIVIASEISRLGRDLYMVMDILHFCMKQGVVIYTVKDNFTLGDDLQSKVLAFAFGLSAEIERQMIRQRTREGLRLRMKAGVLVGRPPGATNREEAQKYGKYKDLVKRMVELQMGPRKIAKLVGCDRNTVPRLIVRWGFDKDWEYSTAYATKAYHRPKKPTYKDGPYLVVDLDRDKARAMIEQDMTIPQMAEHFPEFTYEEVYDTIFCDAELNTLYRQHAHQKIRKRNPVVKKDEGKE